MRILFYTSYSTYAGKCVGGAEVSIELIAEKMAASSEDVFFATVNVPGIPSFRKKKINRVNVYSLSCPQWLDNAAMFFKHYPKLSSYQRRKFIAFIIKKEKIDVVYSYNISDVRDILKAREVYKLSVKVVKRASGLFWEYLLNCGKIKKGQIERVLNCVDAVNYPTPEFKEFFLTTAARYGISLTPKKEIILDIGIDLDSFRYRWKPKKEEIFKIISVSRFTAYQKRQDLLIKALARLKNKNFFVDFIGEGPKLEKHKILCRKLGLSHFTAFHGYLNKQRIIDFFSKADLFVLPSDYEGLSKALLEAMATGIPCLVSDVVPLNSFICDGVNGYLTANTPEQWADKINFICEERGKNLEVSLNARDFVARNYNADENILKYFEEFSNNRIF